MHKDTYLVLFAIGWLYDASPYDLVCTNRGSLYVQKLRRLAAYILVKHYGYKTRVVAEQFNRTHVSILMMIKTIGTDLENPAFTSQYREVIDLAVKINSILYDNSSV